MKFLTSTSCTSRFKLSTFRGEENGERNLFPPTDSRRGRSNEGYFLGRERLISRRVTRASYFARSGSFQRYFLWLVERADG